MSETLSLWQTPPILRPQMMIGAASPLWAYFTGAALTGVALWWMSRWPMSVAALPAGAEPTAQPRKAPALVVVEPVQAPGPGAEFATATAAPRPRRSKPVEVKPR